MTIPVAVAESAAGPLENKATIEGGAVAASTVQPTPVGPASTPFSLLPAPAGLSGFSGQADGSAATQAGSHPYQLTIAAMNLATDRGDLLPLLAAGGGLHEAVVTLPKGEVVDPSAAPRCREAELEEGEAGCPDASQVGTIALTLSLSNGFGEGSTVHPVYNMVPPPGYPAELGFEVVSGTDVHLLASVSSDGTFTVTTASRDVLARVTIGGVRTTLWGVPSDGSHDAQRGMCVFEYPSSTCPVPRTGRPFITLPSSCGARSPPRPRSTAGRRRGLRRRKL